MLPLVLNPLALKGRSGRPGRGPGAPGGPAGRSRGGSAAAVCRTPPDAVLEALQLLFVAGLQEGEARHLAGRARALGVLVNVEDVLPLCDFHVPAIVRRGDSAADRLHRRSGAGPGAGAARMAGRGNSARNGRRG